MHYRRAVTSLLYALCLSMGAAAYAGDITGNVSFTGSLPQRPKVPVTVDQYICGKQKDAEDLVLGPKGAVQHAVVWIDNPPAGAKWPAAPPKAEAHQQGRVVVPGVAVVPWGGS